MESTVIIWHVTMDIYYTNGCRMHVDTKDPINIFFRFLNLWFKLCSFKALAYVLDECPKFAACKKS